VVTDVTTTFTYNADNSIATTIVSGTTLNGTYDTKGAGVMTSDGCEQWTLDTFDRASALAPVSPLPSVCGTTPSTTYTHDANGTMLTEAASGTTTTVHDDPTSSTLIVENVGSTTTAYVLDSSGTPMEAAQGSTAVYLTDDPKGDLSTTMGASIYPLCQIQYDPYGTVVFGLSPSNHCEAGSTFVDLLYQNHRIDGSSGDYQLGSRTYDPSKNSFLSPDHYQLGTPAEDLSIQVDPLTENSYTFVDGDPVNYFDPSGHDPCGNCNGQVPSPGDETGGGGGNCGGNPECTNNHAGPSGKQKPKNQGSGPSPDAGGHNPSVNVPACGPSCLSAIASLYYDAYEAGQEGRSGPCQLNPLEEEVLCTLGGQVVDMGTPQGELHNANFGALSANLAMFLVTPFVQEIPGVDAVVDAADVSAVADMATSGIRVLGSNPLYVNVARAIGGKAFDIPDDVYEAMSHDEQWEANVKFLDRGISARDAFLVVRNGPDGIGLTKELNYLLSHGYDWTSNGLGLVPIP
jgi:RHS repeat-associated protein